MDIDRELEKTSKAALVCRIVAAFLFGLSVFTFRNITGNSISSSPEPIKDISLSLVSAGGLFAALWLVSISRKF